MTDSLDTPTFPCLGRSKAGHDKDRVYVILGLRDSRLICVDGKYRKVGNPKLKNISHIMLELHTDGVKCLRQLYNVKSKITDADAVFILKDHK